MERQERSQRNESLLEVQCLVKKDQMNSIEHESKRLHNDGTQYINLSLNYRGCTIDCHIARNVSFLRRLELEAGRS